MVDRVGRAAGGPDLDVGRQHPSPRRVAGAVAEVELAGDPALVDQRLADGGQAGGGRLGMSSYPVMVRSRGTDRPRSRAARQRAERQQIHQGADRGEVGSAVQQRVQRLGAGLGAVVGAFFDGQIGDADRPQGVLQAEDSAAVHRRRRVEPGRPRPGRRTRPAGWAAMTPMRRCPRRPACHRGRGRRRGRPGPTQSTPGRPGGESTTTVGR